MICGFMHIYQINNWNEIVEQQLYRMKKSGLWDKMDKLFIGFLGKEKIRTYNKKIDILYHIDKPDLYDILILSFLQKVSLLFDGYVFSIHAKGITHYPLQQYTDWRRMMEHYTLDRYKVCLKELETNDLVGINWHLGEGFMGAASKHAEGIEVTPHFSASFWWATTKYIRRLPNIYPIKSKYESEFWIGKGNPKVAELWHTGIHHQKKIYPESNYIGKLNTRYFIGKEEIHRENIN